VKMKNKQPICCARNTPSGTLRNNNMTLHTMS
jgi:hypothetical protein